MDWVEAAGKNALDLSTTTIALRPYFKQLLREKGAMDGLRSFPRV